MILEAQFDGKGKWHRMKTLRSKVSNQWKKYECKEAPAGSAKTFKVRMRVKNSEVGHHHMFHKLVLQGKCPPCKYAKPAWNQCTKVVSNLHTFIGDLLLYPDWLDQHRTVTPAINSLPTSACWARLAATCKRASLLQSW